MGENVEHKKKRWIPLEANPDVMNQFAHRLGLPEDTAFVDVYGFDDDLLAFVPQPVLAVLLLFPYNAVHKARRREEEERIDKDGQRVSPNVYWMPQTVSNACGTIGVLHAIANNRQQFTLAEGSWLQRFFETTTPLSPEKRAKYLHDDTELEAAHSDAAEEGDTAAPSLEENVDFHFIAFACVDGDLYELDGSKRYAINHGPSSADTILQDAVKVIKEFMAADPANVRFNAIALSKS